MSILKDIEIAIEPIIEDAKQWAGKAITFLEGVPIMLELKAIELIKGTSLGTAIMNLISAAEVSTASGADKLSAVLAGAENGYKAFVENGGLLGLIEVGVSILRGLVETLVANFKAAFAS